MNAQEVIDQFKKDEEEYQEGAIIEPGIKGAVVGILTRAAKGEANRHLVLKVLTGHTSSKEIADRQWYALLRLVEPEKPEGGKWQSAKGEYILTNICGQLIVHGMVQAGQTELGL